MSSLIDSGAIRGKPSWWIALGFGAALVLVAVATPNLMRSRTDAEPGAPAQRQLLEQGPSSDAYYGAATKAKPVAMIAGSAAPGSSDIGSAPEGVSGGRKMIRTSGVDLVVQRPAEVAEKIRSLAETQGGFLVGSDVRGGQNATSGSLTIRVPVAHFEETWAEIRKLGLRVEAESIQAQDVTRQYVDEDATLRNLRAEETQYLAILKQARTVKDMLEVNGKLSEVSGKIEQQQAEFDALSKQVETVAIAISLRTEAEAQVFGLNWRPLYQMKLALRDGLDAVGNYAAVMTSILFYLPAVSLWLGTIVVSAVVGWKVWRWVGRVFFAGPKESAVQNG